MTQLQVRLQVNSKSDSGLTPSRTIEVEEELNYPPPPPNGSSLSARDPKNAASIEPLEGGTG